jgi:hypothetical protein
MNNLSWFIYLTQIVDNIGNAAQGVLVFVGVFGGIGLVFATAYRFAECMGDDPFVPVHRRLVKLFIIAIAVSAMAAVFVPSRQTMLLIAGSEIGERFTKSEAARDVVSPGVELLKTWIKRETEKLSKEASK